MGDRAWGDVLAGKADATCHAFDQMPLHKVPKSYRFLMFLKEYSTQLVADSSLFLANTKMFKIQCFVFLYFSRHVKDSKNTLTRFFFF